MSDARYIIFGSEMSPYSVKVRSYFRYKQLPHLWVPRNASNDAEYQRVAKLPIVPTVVTPEGEPIQDSTPIIEAVEKRAGAPAIHPDDGDLAFVSALLEEFGDEWGNKLMFHHRWYAEVDQLASAQTLARLAMPDGDAESVEARRRMVLERMPARGHFVGSSPETAPLITRYYVELVDLLEAHLVGRRYLLGARPCFGDFGLAGQMYEASIDPTCGSIVRARGPAVLDWCHRMLEPRGDGAFETLESLKPTLAPLLSYVGRYFLPWSRANAKALAEGAETFTVELAGEAYTQRPQKYHAKSLAALQAKFAKARTQSLERLLSDCGCLEGLTP